MTVNQALEISRSCRAFVARAMDVPFDGPDNRGEYIRAVAVLGCEVERLRLMIQRQWTDDGALVRVEAPVQTMSGRVIRVPTWKGAGEKWAGQLHRWLLAAAVDEAVARGDEFNHPLFENEVASFTRFPKANVPKATHETAWEYLFVIHPLELLPESVSTPSARDAT